MLVVLLQADRQIYAIPAADVVEVIPRIALRTVVGAPSWFAGLGNIRGEIVPVIDLAARLGERPAAPVLSSRIALVRRGGEPSGALVGVLAERMTGTARLSARQTSLSLAVPHAPFLGEVLLEDSKLVQLILARHLISQDIERFLFAEGTSRG